MMKKTLLAAAVAAAIMIPAMTPAARADSSAQDPESVRMYVARQELQKSEGTAGWTGLSGGQQQENSLGLGVQLNRSAELGVVVQGGQAPSSLDAPPTVGVSNGLTWIHGQYDLDWLVGPLELRPGAALGWTRYSSPGQYLSSFVVTPRLSISAGSVEVFYRQLPYGARGQFLAPQKIGGAWTHRLGDGDGTVRVEVAALRSGVPFSAGGVGVSDGREVSLSLNQVGRRRAFYRIKWVGGLQFQDAAGAQLDPRNLSPLDPSHPGQAYQPGLFFEGGERIATNWLMAIDLGLQRVRGAGYNDVYGAPDTRESSGATFGMQLIYQPRP